MKQIQTINLDIISWPPWVTYSYDSEILESNGDPIKYLEPDIDDEYYIPPCMPVDVAIKLGGVWI